MRQSRSRRLRQEVSVMKAEMISLKAATTASHSDTQFTITMLPHKGLAIKRIDMGYFAIDVVRMDTKK